MSRALLTRAALPRFLRVRFDLDEFELLLLKLGREAWRIKEAERSRRSLAPRSLPPRSIDSSLFLLEDDEEEFMFWLDMIGCRWNNRGD